MSRRQRPGRPPIGEPITVRLPPSVLRDVDRHAAAAGMTRAAYLRALITAALPPDDVDRTQIRRLLALTPAERVARNEANVRQMAAIRGAARR